MKSKIFILFLFIVSNFEVLAQNSKDQIAGSSSENEVRFLSSPKFLRLVADSSTHDSIYGMTERMLEFHTLNTDSVDGSYITRIMLLPPSLLNQKTKYRFVCKYEADQKFVIVQGGLWFYVYDAVQDKLTYRIFPKMTTKPGTKEDAALITSLLLSANGRSLTGETKELGKFYFDLSNPLKPRQAQPAE